MKDVCSGMGGHGGVLLQQPIKPRIIILYVTRWLKHKKKIALLDLVYSDCAED